MLDFVALLIRLSRPLVLAGLGGVVSERAGVANIGLEGMMLTGAFASVAAAQAGGMVVGVLAGIAAGALVGLLHAVLTQAFRVPHILSGVGINLFALSVTTFLVRTYPNQTLETPNRLPEAAATLLVVLLVPLVFVLLYKTPLGLRLRACGEKPGAVTASGIAIAPLRYGALAASGALAGLGGTVLALAGLGAFTENMTAGRGYIALAAVIFGRWHPVWATLAALFFALGDGLQLTMQTAGVSKAIPSDLLALLPYGLTLLVLAGVSGKNAAPAALATEE